MIKKLFSWLSQIFCQQKVYKAKTTDDMPDTFAENRVYIIQNEGYSWQAVMVCPCGCKNILHMNLIKEYKPSWKLEVYKNKIVTLHPSISRTVGCKSHFFIRKGKVIWA
ncbi:DUF6527 family protein [Parafilimonas sp.]|uniref:DUF6527 family protein n=1 Tax=Parafilimonas sp. TaxID=1969739 RepID=UPI003F8156DD